MIKIIADSTCDLSEDLIAKYGIGIAPLNITINGKNYKDRVDIQADEFYKMLPDLETLPTTAMPSPAEFYELMENAFLEGDREFLVITMSSGTSGSHQSADIAKNMFLEHHLNDDVKVHVVDSLSMSHGSGWLILKSARLRERGMKFEELVDFNEAFKKHVKHFLSVDDLNNLIKSGRLTNASAFLGKLLRIKPIMSMRDGKGAIVAKERGQNKVVDHYIAAFKERNHPEMNDFIIIGYTSNIQVAEKLKEKFLEETGYKGEVLILQMGVAVGTHVGLGGLSMFFMEKDRKHDGLLVNELNSLRERKDGILARIKELYSGDRK
jgi:DegV family protein with EDD domain